MSHTDQSGRGSLPIPYYVPPQNQPVDSRGFGTGSNIIFQVPQQYLELLGHVLVFDVEYVNSSVADNTTLVQQSYESGTRTLTITQDTNYGLVNFPPTNGAFNAFSQYVVERNESRAKLDLLIYPQWDFMLKSMFRFQNAATFSSQSCGIHVYPTMEDAGTDTRRVIPNSTIGLRQSCYIRLPMGIFNALESINLNVSSGIQIVLTVAQGFNSLQFAISSEANQWNALTNTNLKDNGALLGAVRINGFNMTAQSSKAVLSNYNMYVVNPRLYMMCKPATNVPGQAFPYVATVFTPITMSLGLNQNPTLPLNNNIVKSIAHVPIDRTNPIDNPAIGNCHTMTTGYNDITHYLNGSLQIFAAPVMSYPASVQSSSFTPEVELTYLHLQGITNLLCNSIRGGPNYLLYDPLGAGLTFQSTSLQANITLASYKTLMTVNNGTNSYNLALPIPFEPMPSGLSGTFGQMSKYISCSSTAHSSSLWWMNTFYYDVMFNCCSKYSLWIESRNTTFDVEARTETRTNLINATGATAIPEAPLPSVASNIFDFKQAPMSSEVKRVIDNYTNGQSKETLYDNATTVSFQLPPAGTQGSSYFWFTPIRDNDGSWAPITGQGSFNSEGYWVLNNETGQTTQITITFICLGTSAYIATVPAYIALGTQAVVPYNVASIGTIVYDSCFGQNSSLFGVSWSLGNAIEARFPYMNTQYYINHHADPTNQNLITNWYIRRGIRHYYQGSNSKLSDVSWRVHGTLGPESQTFFNWDNATIRSTSKYENVFRDYPRGMTDRKCLVGSEIHDSFRLFQRTPLNNSQCLWFLNLWFSNSLEYFANIDCGTGYGLHCSMDISKLLMAGYTNGTQDIGGQYKSVYSQTITGACSQSFNDINASTNVILRKVDYAWHVVPTDVLMLMQLVYYPPEVMSTLLRTLQVDGYIQNYIQANLQYNRFESDPEAAQPSLDQLAPNSSIFIAGRNPVNIKVLHQPLRIVNGQPAITTDQQTVEPDYNVNTHKTLDLYTFPGYIGCRNSPHSTSLPSAVFNPDQSARVQNRDFVSTFQCLIDETALYPSFNLNSPSANAIMAYYQYNTTLQQPAHLVEFGTPAKHAFFESRGFMTNTFINANDNVYNMDAATYRGCPLLPWNYVSLIKIPPESENGSYFKLNEQDWASLHNEKQARFNFIHGFDMIYGTGVGSSNTITTILNKVGKNGNANYYKHGTLPTYNTQNLLRTYCLMERMTLTVFADQAAIALDYPAGGVFV